MPTSALAAAWLGLGVALLAITLTAQLKVRREGELARRAPRIGDLAVGVLDLTEPDDDTGIVLAAEQKRA